MRSSEFPTHYKIGVLNGKDVYLHPQMGLAIKRGDCLAEMTAKETAVWYRQETRSLRDHPKRPTEPLSMHGLYADGSPVPDWIYNGHYDCGDK